MWTSEQQYDEAAARIGELAAHIHAAQAELARLVADFDDSRLWFGIGIHTCQHWLTINTGLNMHSADELVRVGHALRELPRTREAFATGRLSLDKVRTLTRVAVAADEDVWLHLAVEGSGAQFARIVRAYERTSGDGGQADVRRARRGLWTFWRTDGMLELRAVLPAEDGAMVLEALNAVAEHTGTPRRTPSSILVNGGTMEEASAAALDPADDPAAAGRADALALMSEQVVSTTGGDGMRREAVHRVVVHVDLGALTGEDPRGRCHIENGSGLSLDVARRIGCDAEVIAIAEREGAPVDVGRRRRFPSARLRLAVTARDGGCQFVSCPVTSRKHLHVHHVVHWADGGQTAMSNLITLCRFHHARHHDGAFTIELDAENRPVFRDWRGRVIGEPRPPLRDLGRAALRRLLRGNADGITAQTPVAGDHGRRFDFPLAVELVHCNTAHARRVAAAGASP